MIDIKTMDGYESFLKLPLEKQIDSALTLIDILIKNYSKYNSKDILEGEALFSMMLLEKSIDINMKNSKDSHEYKRAIEIARDYFNKYSDAVLTKKELSKGNISLN